jgi:hypothetical protein
MMAVKTLLAKRKYWDVRVSTWRLLTAPPAVLVLTLALSTAGIWVLDFGGPAAWHALFGTRVVHLGILGKFSLGNIVLGVVIGQVLHRFWAPVGATLQGFILERLADRAQSPSVFRSGPRVPFWETYPAAPPVVRERFALVWRRNERVIHQVSRSRFTTSRAARVQRAVLTAVVFFLFFLLVYGVLAKFVIAHGTRIPYINP